MKYNMNFKCQLIQQFFIFLLCSTYPMSLITYVQAYAEDFLFTVDGNTKESTHDKLIEALDRLTIWSEWIKLKFRQLL